MNSQDALPGDIFTHNGSHFTVLEVEIMPNSVKLKLAAGRTDTGFWAGPWESTNDLDLYRPQAQLRHD